MAEAKRQAAEQRGRKGERLAALFLQMRGYSILDRRVRTPLGEVDLIARRGDLIAFVEVKHRATLDAAGGSVRVNTRTLSGSVSDRAAAKASPSEA